MNENQGDSLMRKLWRTVAAAGALRAPARREKRLRLCETLSLGEKRFLAVVQVESQQFLVGGSGNSIALLTELPPAGGAGAAGDRRPA